MCFQALLHAKQQHHIYLKCWDSSVIVGNKLLLPLNYWHRGLCLYSSGTVIEWVWEFSIFSLFRRQWVGIELTADEVNDIDIIRPTFGWLCQMCTRPWWQRSFLITSFFCVVSPLTTLLNSLKMCCFLLQLVSIWGQLSFRHGCHFLSLCETLHSGPCAVSQQRCGVGAFSSLTHMLHMEVLRLHVLFTLLQQQTCLGCKCRRLNVPFGSSS